MSGLAVLFRRELALSWGRGGGPLLALAFYAAMATLLPLATGPAPARLAVVAPGSAWLALALASLLSLERLFERDFEDGALDLLALGPAPLEAVAFAKCLAQWIATGAPLALAAPIAAIGLGAAAASRAADRLHRPGRRPGLLLLRRHRRGAQPRRSRRGGVLIAVIVLPLFAPPVIFGAGAIEAFAGGPGLEDRPAAARRLQPGRRRRSARSPWRRPAATRYREPRCSPSSHQSRPVHGLLALGRAAVRRHRGRAGRDRPVARFRRPARLPAGLHRPDHVHPRAGRCMSLFVYACLGVASFLGLVFRHALADAAARAAAPLGAGFTLLALVTGSLWGRPMWGAWWVWDARLTSVLVLFLFYLGYMALQAAIDDEAKAARACAILALVGRGQPADRASSRWTGGTACTRARPCSRQAGPAMAAGLSGPAAS